MRARCKAGASANGALGARLVFAEKLFSVFGEADQNHDDRPHHPQQKERLEQPNYDRGQDHEWILPQLARSRDVLHSPQYAIVLEAVGRSGTFRSLA